MFAICQGPRQALTFPIQSRVFKLYIDWHMTGHIIKNVSSLYSFSPLMYHTNIGNNHKYNIITQCICMCVYCYFCANKV